MSKKKWIAGAIGVVVTLGVVGGAVWGYKTYQSNTREVTVQPVSYVNWGYWGDTETSYGMVTNDSSQEIYLSDAKTIKEIYVKEGDSVKVGDPLIAYDTVELGLSIERKKLDVSMAETELAKALAEALYPGRGNLIRLDMSEYLEKHAASRLVGSPPGYVGYGEGGQLTERVKEKPSSVVLLDEIEKAHPDVLNLLLQMLEEGCLTDGTGAVVSFRDTVVILTSNLGSEAANKQPTGFLREQDGGRGRVMAAVKQAIRPELLGRLDGVVAFGPLESDSLREILRRRLTALAEGCEKQGMVFTWDESAEDLLLEACRERALGARPLRQLVESQVEDPLATAVLLGAAGKTARLTAQNGQVRVLWEQPAAV